jgi:hypothetical protein
MPPRKTEDRCGGVCDFDTPPIHGIPGIEELAQAKPGDTI